MSFANDSDKNARRRQLLEAMRREKGLQKGDAAGEIPHLPGPAPLSTAQERLWFLNEFDPGNPVYNICLKVSLDGALDLPAFEAALQAVEKRQQILSAVVATENGTPLLKNGAATATLERADLSALSPEEQSQALFRLGEEAGQTRFDLAKGPLYRVILARLSPERHLFLLTKHHLICDTESFAIYFRELSNAYATAVGKAAPPLATPAIQFGDYARWERQRLDSKTLEAQAAYWREKLGGELPVLDLRSDRPRPATLTYRGELIKRSLSPALSERLRAFARSEQVTLFMVLLSAFKVLLLRYTRQEDILVGTPIANRERKEIQDLIGYFQNTVTLRSDLSGNPTFRELLKRISTTAREAFANQSLPFERVVELVQPLRDKSLTPLFQCAFTFNSYTAAETWQNTLQLPGIVATTEMYHNRTAKFDLSLGMVDEGERIGAALEYATDLFEAATMEDLLSHFETLLESILASPDRPIGDLDLLNPAEEQAVLENWRRRDPEVPEDQTLHGLVTAQGVRTPDRIALRFGERELSYRELERQADHLARRLIARGAAPGRIVGVFLERSEKLPLALLGILKSGAAYLPLDPGHPPTRLQMILADAGATLLVSEQACREQLPDTLPDMMFIDDGEDSPDSSAVTLPDLSAGELAYLIYTSGSTGQPKGVEIPHRAIVNFLWSMREEPGIVPEDNLLAVTTPAFDISLLEIFLPLIAGATVEICPAHLTGDGAGLLRHIREKGITMMQATPATWRLMLESGWNDPLPIKVLCGGEALPDDLRQALLARGVELWNMYGPTETTVWSTLARIEDSEAPITIGKPIANTDIYVLDSRNRPCPPGVPGELCIGGRGLARGYRNRPELTAQKFFEFMPTSGGPARRIYRTGDLACLLANGQIAYLGRLDFQLKIRGFRIEAGEVEKALMTVEGIEQAVVVGKNFGSGDTRLVAYLTAGARSEPALLRSRLGEILPPYMVPGHFIYLEKLPLSPSGKIDRKALPLPSVQSAPTFLAPASETERLLCAIWENLLGIERVGSADNFFELGGHSLKVTQVLTRIEHQFGIRLPLRDFFDDPTVAALAQRIEARNGQGGDALALTAGLAEADQPAPLSQNQQRLWFLEQLEPGNPAYHIPALYRLEGELDAELLQQTLDLVVERHQALRTTINLKNGLPVQVIHPDMRVPISRRDWPGGDIEETFQEELRRPFDFAKGPLMRVVLWRESPSQHLVMFTLHHIIADGWSMSLLTREIAGCYQSLVANQPGRLPDLPVQYPDFAVWQQQSLSGTGLEEHQAYWLEELKDLAALEMPTDFPRPAVPGYLGGMVRLDLSPRQSQALRTFCREKGVTQYMALLALIQVLLHRYSGQEDVAVGSPVAGRDQQACENLIGFFVNTVVMRGQPNSTLPFAEYLQSVYRTSLAALSHQQMPFEKLVALLHPERDTSRHPLFQVMFMMQNEWSPDLDLPGMRSAPLLPETGLVKFDLTFSALEKGEELSLFLEYSKDLFEKATARRLLDQLGNLLEAVIREPGTAIGDLPLLSAEETHTLLETWNETEASYPREAGLPTLFEAQAQRTPEAIALQFGDLSQTYSQVNEAANRLANHLISQGVKPGQYLGVFLERSAFLPVTLLAILKCGAAYLPLDPAYPAGRLKFVLEDSGANLLLSEKSLAAQVADLATLTTIFVEDVDLAGQSSQNPGVEISPESPAYLIYTSGSTGNPKGVQIPHRAVVNFLTSMRESPGIAPRDVLLAVTTPSFDISVLEIFLPLISGARVVIAAQEATGSGRALLELIDRHRVSIMQATPATWRILLDALGEHDSLALKALCGGEAMPLDLKEKLLEKGAELWNMYGPTETTIWSTVKMLTKEDGIITIGRPIANTRIYILDSDGKPQPPGIPGELCIGGDGLATGYLHRPALNREKFIEIPLPNGRTERIYRTGDLARYRNNGEIECLGRLDFQLKIRGFRIEAGEVEAALLQHPGIAEAAVVGRSFGPGDTRLIAFLVSADQQPLRPGEIRKHCRELLPPYMVPAHFSFLEALPLTPNGKVNRQALGLPEDSSRAAKQDGAPPETDMEKKLAAIWCNLLRVGKVGRQDNFFDLGGHSLLSLQAINAVFEETGAHLTPRDMLLQTLAQLAAKVGSDSVKAEETTSAERESENSGGLFGRIKRSFGKS